MPPHWRADPGRLADLLDALPATLRCAFEFRDASWHCDTIYDAAKPWRSDVYLRPERSGFPTRNHR
ncbi:DUF72 domain-containing protein [Acidihalobacter aeolianus]|uniref:DUF72 domain-containing protein n=1 Tax=Acidihalobacter aeolianus TaxID=2792603 RepID=UPI0038B3A639